jgi:hypothetical protein
MKKTIIYLTVLLIGLTVSCTKDFTKTNTNPASFTSAEPEAILTGVFVNTINKFESNNIIYLWEYSHLIDPIGRYIGGDDGGNATWTWMYANILGNTRQLKKLYEGNPAYTNRVAIADIWECYVYAYLVGTYGPIPYEHAGDITNTDVEYTDENSIYTSLLSRLKADAAAIKTTGDKLNPDVIYGGDLIKWTKFANTLRLRIALTVQHNLPDLAVTNIRELMTNESMLIGSDADDPKLTYGTATGSQSQYNLMLVQGTSFTGTAAPVMSDYVFTYFRSYHDPRLDAYFTKAATPFNITDTLTSKNDARHHIVVYPIPHLGQPKSTGVLSQWGIVAPPFSGATVPINYSTLPPALTAATRPFYMMTFAEVCFMKAEAAQLGYGGAQTAEQYYYAGINANFAFWGLTPAQATAYEAQDGIKWGTAGKGFNYVLGFINTSIPADNMTKIWIQQWINFFDDEAFEAWVLQRRTRNLVLPPHTNPGSINVLTTYANLNDRWPYPIKNEVQNNPVGYANGVKMLGGEGDYVFTPLKFEPTYTPTDWTKVRAFVDQSFVQKWYGNNIEDLTAAGIKYTELSAF